MKHIDTGQWNVVMVVTCGPGRHVFEGDKCLCGGRYLTKEVCNLGHEHVVERGVVPRDDGSLRRA